VVCRTRPERKFDEICRAALTFGLRLGSYEIQSAIRAGWVRCIKRMTRNSGATLPSKSYHEYAVTGSPDADTITLKKIAPRTAEVVLLHAGKHMATVRREISEDGQTMTISYEGELLGDHVDYVAVTTNRSRRLQFICERWPVKTQKAVGGAGPDSSRLGCVSTFCE
jgi:hypothetical protein